MGNSLHAVSVTDSQPDPIFDKIISAAYTYEELLGKYSHKQGLKFIKRVPRKGTTAYRLWEKVVTSADEMGVSCRFFIKASFYFLHEWYKSAPKPKQLTTDGAKDRAERYKNLVERELVNPDSDIFGLVLPSQPIAPSVVDHFNQTTLANTMKAHNLTEEQVFVCFPGLFNRKWLMSHPTYKRLKEQKKL